MTKRALKDVRPQLLEEWHPTKNASISFEELTAGSSKRVWWRCKNGHEWQAYVYSRSKGIGCPYCSGKRIGKDNCLQILNPILAAEWHPTRNVPLTPQDVGRASGKRVWWQCEKGHDWQTSVANRSSGTGCPFCRRVANETDRKDRREKSSLKYRLIHHEEIKARGRAYYAAHKPEIREYGQKYRLAHSDQERERHRRYKLIHREEIRAKAAAYNKSHAKEQREYRLAHKEKISVYGRLRRLEHEDEIRARARARYHAIGPEERKNKNRAYYVAHQPTLIARSRAFQKNFPEKARAYRLKQLYGLTRDEFDRLLVEQGGVCAICKRADWPGNGQPALDHSHATGKVRGILCNKCNTALGLLKDNPRIIKALIEYLNRYRTRFQAKNKGSSF